LGKFFKVTQKDFEHAIRNVKMKKPDLKAGVTPVSSSVFTYSSYHKFQNTVTDISTTKDVLWNPYLNSDNELFLENANCISL